MSTIPADLRYTKDHEWVKLESDGTVKIGITDHAQKQLGDLVYVELPKPGDRWVAQEAVGSIESVKAVAEIYCPLSGTVVACNEELNASPEFINEEPYGAWVFAMRPDSAKELDSLLDAAEYEKYITESE